MKWLHVYIFNKINAMFAYVLISFAIAIFTAKTPEEWEQWKMDFEEREKDADSCLHSPRK